MFRRSVRGREAPRLRVVRVAAWGTQNARMPRCFEVRVAVRDRAEASGWRARLRIASLLAADDAPCCVLRSAASPSSCRCRSCCATLEHARLSVRCSALRTRAFLSDADADRCPPAVVAAQRRLLRADGNHGWQGAGMPAISISLCSHGVCGSVAAADAMRAPCQRMHGCALCSCVGGQGAGCGRSPLVYC